MRLPEFCSLSLTGDLQSTLCTVVPDGFAVSAWTHAEVANNPVSLDGLATGAGRRRLRLLRPAARPRPFAFRLPAPRHAARILDAGRARHVFHRDGLRVSEHLGNEPRGGEIPEQTTGTPRTGARGTAGHPRPARRELPGRSRARAGGSHRQLPDRRSLERLPDRERRGIRRWVHG